jgi:hypothetical protein
MDFELRTARYLGGAMLALGVALPHLPGNPGLPCPLRTLTGVPCPFCGLTTSVKAALHGDGHAAWGANPFGLLLIALAIAMVARPRWRRLRVPTLMVVSAVAVSWLFELHRYHFV